MAFSSNGIGEDIEEFYWSDDEGNSVEELQEEITKVETLLKKMKKKLQQRKMQKGKVNDSTTPSIQKEALNRQKKVSRLHNSVITTMYRMMEQCGVKGFVFGFIQENGKAVANASQNLWSLWNSKVQFDKNGPPALVNGALPISVTSTPRSLLEMHDTTIGTLLSALLQHCDPPQKKFPLDKGVAPPWWPKGDEEWWPELGFEEGAPIPYKKPHDLKKAMKVGVLITVIRHISPDFDKIDKLVLHNKYLPGKMTENDTSIWNAVLSHEKMMAVNNDHLNLQNIGSEAVDHGLKRKSPCADTTFTYGGNPQGLEEMFASKQPMIFSDLPVEPTSDQVASSSRVFANQYQEAASGSMSAPSSDVGFSDEMWIPQNPNFDHSIFPITEMQGGLDDTWNVQNPNLESSLHWHDVQDHQNPNFDHSSPGNDTWTFPRNYMWNDKNDV